VGDRRSLAPRLHQFPRQPGREAAQREENPRRRGELRPLGSRRGAAGDRGVRLGQPHRAAARGHGRQAALGDAIGALLESQGSRVTREYYYNDAGAQIRNLGLSVQARIREKLGMRAEFPADGYHGDYVREIAEKYLAAGNADGEDLDAVTRFAVAEIRKEQDLDLQAFGVRFDNYYLESSSTATGASRRRFGL